MTTVAVAKITGERRWKKVSLHNFLADLRLRGCGKKLFWDILQHQQQIIACCQTHSDYGPPKMSLKFAV